MTHKLIGHVQPGEEIIEKRGRRIIPVGIVDAITKDVPRRSIVVALVGGGGFSQNWAAKVWVR